MSKGPVFKEMTLGVEDSEDEPVNDKDKKEVIDTLKLAGWDEVYGSWSFHKERKDILVVNGGMLVKKSLNGEIKALMQPMAGAEIGVWGRHIGVSNTIYRDTDTRFSGIAGQSSPSRTVTSSRYTGPGYGLKIQERDTRLVVG